MKFFKTKEDGQIKIYSAEELRDFAAKNAAKNRERKEAYKNSETGKRNKLRKESIKNLVGLA